MSLLTKLGLEAPKVKADTPRVMAAAGGPGDTAPGVTAQGAPGAQMLNDATQYAQVLADAQAALAGLGADPSLAAEKAKIQTGLIDVARGLAKAGGYKGAMSLLGQVSGKVAAALAKATGDYEKDRAEAQKLVDALEKHPQKAKVQAGLNTAKTKLAQAKVHADKKEFDAAVKLVAEAKKAAADATVLAGKWADYATKRADAQAMVNAGTGVFDATLTGPAQTKINQADAKVAGANPDFPAALTLIEAVRTTLGDKVKAWYATQTKSEIARVKAKPGADYVAADIKQMETNQAEVDAAIAASAWTKAMLAGRRIWVLLGPTDKLADRIVAYRQQKAKTDTALAPLKARPAAKDVLAALMLRYAAAEKLASRASAHPEQGSAEMAAIEAACAGGLLAADAAEAYGTDRATADAAFAALQKHAAADKLSEPIGAVRQQLADAANLATAAAKADALANWTAARTRVTRALADLAAAKTLADSLGPAVDAEAAASSAKDAPSLKKAIAALRASGDAALKAPFADRADKAFKAYTAALSQAEEAGAEGDLKAAGINLGKAARSLADAQTIQVEHGHYEVTAKAIDDRLKALQAAPAPMPTAIKAKIDALVRAIADAGVRDKAHQGAAALAAIRAAGDVATAAEQARKDREAFDVHLKAVRAIVEALGDGDAKKLHRLALGAAVDDANAFAFADARHVLKVTQGRIAAEKIKGLAAANPNDPAIATTVKEMMSSGGGGAQVDELIGSLPPGTDKKVVTTIAKERFGIDFQASSASSTADMQRLCKVLAKVPQDVVKNPSLKLLKHEKPGNNGGAYGSIGGAIEMNGRPGQSYQQFGPNLKNASGGDQLGPVEDKCKPANNDPVDYMDFAALHEVGHSVDDAQTFMASREGKADFGGWKEFGGKVEPIADAVAAEYKYDRKYVLDKILRLKPQPPAPPKGVTQAQWDARQADVDNWHRIATAKDVWWRQGDCDKITIGGQIYHEAYEMNWVGYLASARKKGMTGYQFRAPAEWFAELYASYHSGKIKNGHPSEGWLKKLSV
jgi:hypothetical protein